jgi:hypothetical protein
MTRSKNLFCHTGNDGVCHISIIRFVAADLNPAMIGLNDRGFLCRDAQFTRHAVWRAVRPYIRARGVLKNASKIMFEKSTCVGTRILSGIDSIFNRNEMIFGAS